MKHVPWQEIERVLNCEIEEAREALESADDFIKVNRLQAKIELARDLKDSLQRTQD
jgi:hypothetical protein